MFETPIVVIIYNRADKVKRLMDAIRKIEPRFIYLVADGPKRDSQQDFEQTRKAQDAFWSGITWDCKVSTNVAEENMGCGKRISSGLDWVFAHVDEAIILEDDCIPSESFFRFCSEMLELYRDDVRIGTISGSNFLPSGFVSDFDYFVSDFTHVWGWATWRRVWGKYSFDILGWPEDRKSVLSFVPSQTKDSKRYWSLAFEGVSKGVIDTWDYQLSLMLWRNSLKSIVPAISLVRNIGFDSQATNTLVRSRDARLVGSDLEWPLRRPKGMVTDKRADEFTSHTQYEFRLFEYLLRRLYIVLPLFARQWIKKLIRLAIR